MMHPFTRAGCSKAAAALSEQPAPLRFASMPGPCTKVGYRSIPRIVSSLHARHPCLPFLSLAREPPLPDALAPSSMAERACSTASAHPQKQLGPASSPRPPSPFPFAGACSRLHRLNASSRLPLGHSVTLSAAESRPPCCIRFHARTMPGPLPLRRLGKHG